MQYIFYTWNIWVLCEHSGDPLIHSTILRHVGDVGGVIIEILVKVQQNLCYSATLGTN